MDTQAMNLILFFYPNESTPGMPDQIQRSSTQQRSSQGQGGDQRQVGSSRDRDICKWSVTKHVLNTCRTDITHGDLKVTCDTRCMPPHKTQDGRNFTVPSVMF